jgi:hypothetical protein
MATREQIRARIDALECLADVQQAIEEVEAVEWEPREPQHFALDVSAGKSVTFVHGIPPSVLLAGLRAMAQELSALETEAA